MLFIINTSRRYSDLDFGSMSLSLFESESSPTDIAENLDFILEGESTDVNIEITTLSEVVINRVGYLIEKGYLDHESVKIRIYENGNFKVEAGYDKEGYLNENWIMGLFTPPEKEQNKK